VSDSKKSRKQLLDEIASLRGRLERLEDAEGKWKCTEEALRESERDKSLILDSISELITYQDNSMKVAWANKAAGDSVGQSPEELVGRYCYEIWYQRQEPCQDCPVQKSIETDRPQEGELTSPDGRVWYTRGRPVLNEQGEVIGAVEVALEITQRKRAEQSTRESEKRFRDITENAFAWIWEVDVNGKYTYTSPVVEKILGYKPEEVLGKHFYDLFHPEEREELKNAAFEVFAKELPFREFINRNVHKNGKTVVWLSTSGVPTRNKEGKLLGYRGVDIDITDLKWTEGTLQESENLLQTVIDSTKDAMISIGEDGFIALFNPAAEEMFGRKREEMVGAPLDCLMPEEYRQRHQEYVKSYFSTGKPDEAIGRVMELPGLRRDGNVFPMAISLSPGMVGGRRFVIAVARDITERKQAEEKLRQSEERFRNIFENTTIGIYQTAPDGRILMANPALVQMLGFESFDELAKRNLEQEGFEPGYPRSDFKQRIEREGQVGGMESMWTRQDGTRIFIRENAKRIADKKGNTLYYEGTIEDISDRKQAEEQLQIRDKAIESSISAIAIAEPGGNLVYVNPAFLQMWGYDGIKDVVGKPAVQFWQFEDLAEEVVEILRAKGKWTGELSARRKDGTEFDVQIMASTVKRETGKPDYTMASFIDITERKKADLALENRREFERLITHISRQFVNLSSEQIDEGINQALKVSGEFAEVDRSYIFQFSDDGRKTSNTHEWCPEGVTPQIDNLQGLSVDMLPWWMDKLAKFENIYIPDVEKLPASAKNEKKILQAQSIQSLIVIPMVYSRKLVGFVGFDSVLRKRSWSEESIAMLTIVSEIFTNTLMRRRIQREMDLHYEKMRRAEQLASLGTISATIAHELSQPLTVIRLFLQQGLRTLKDNNGVDNIAEMINDCLDEITKAASTVDRFRRFARKASPVYVAEVDLVDVAERVAGLFSESARRKKLDLSVNVKSRPPHIIGNSVELEQMFFVLIQNAIQAADGQMSRDMTITISTQPDQTQLTFADTCGGIKHENMDKIFEPFFTTKPPNIGTGLGLCILERIVKRHGGSVRVKSREGQGTIFYIGLPVKN